MRQNIQLVEDTRTPLEVAIFHLKRGDDFEQIKSLMQSQYKISHYDFVLDIVENEEFKTVLAKMQQNRRFEMLEYAERCLYQKTKNGDIEASAFVLERVGGDEWKSKGKEQVELGKFNFVFTEEEKKQIRNIK